MLKIKQQNLDWSTVTRKGVNFELFFVSILARGFIACNSQKKKYFGPLYVRHYRQIDSDRGFLKKDIDKFSREIRIKEAKEPGSILKSYLDYEKNINQLKNFAIRLGKINFSGFSNKKLANFLEKYLQVGGKTVWRAYNYFFCQYLGEELYKIIRQREKNLKKQAEIFEVLTQAKKFSTVQEEKKKLVQLAQKIKEKKLNLNSQKVGKLIDEHLKNYSYMGFYYFRGKPWTAGDVKKRLKSLLKENLKLELKKIKNLEKANQNWLSLARKFRFNKKEILLVKTIKQMTYCINLFDETWNYCVFQSQPLLNGIAKRLAVTYSELIEIDIMEVVDFLRKNKKVDKKFKKEIHERKKDSLYLMVDNKTKILIGKDLAAYRRREAKKVKVIKDIKELKGQPASVGRAQGRVAFVFEVEDLSKVKRGDILVAKMTVPSFVPAMERAAAIITEVGGLLSHAAIVSRELSTPCVVGVDRVTEILKDGDLVEVDAEKGVVKKL